MNSENVLKHSLKIISKCIDFFKKSLNLTHMNSGKVAKLYQKNWQILATTIF